MGILAVTAAGWGQVACPYYAWTIYRKEKGNSEQSLAERLRCPGCDRQTRWGQYRQNYQGQPPFHDCLTAKAKIPNPSPPPT